MAYRKVIYILLGICVISFWSCGPKAVAPKAVLDTPFHHVTNGNKLLKSGKVDAAFREFDRAKALDPKFAPAYIGLGLCYGQQGDFDKGLDHLATGKRYAKSREEKANVQIGYMQLYLSGREKISKNWLDRVENAYKAAKDIDDSLPGPHYFMGLAYKMDHQFSKASEQFKAVLKINKGYIAEANSEYAVIQNIERAMPGTEMGKKIALVEKLTRADAAALLVQELDVETLFNRSQQESQDTRFESPDDQFHTDIHVKISPAIDIAAHPLKADIDTVVALQIKGLEPFPDHTFKPEKLLTRAEFAMMMEDALIRITGMNQLSTRYIGSPSPFPDLRSDLPYFNAAMTCTTRGILSVKDQASGAFDAMGPVSGAEAILGIRRLKSQF